MHFWPILAMDVLYEAAKDQAAAGDQGARNLTADVGFWPLEASIFGPNVSRDSQFRKRMTMTKLPNTEKLGSPVSFLLPNENSIQ